VGGTEGDCATSLRYAIIPVTMAALPTLKLGIANGWILMVAYFIGFLVALLPFSGEDRARLFADPKIRLHGPKKLALRLGQLCAVAFVALTLLTPITRAALPLVVGICLCLVGTASVLLALRTFRRAGAAGPATSGLYGISRNPQWVGLFLVLLGTAITSGAWLMIALVLAVGAIYHLQIVEEEKLCRTVYGQAYVDYTQRVPRYLLWF
jgi:protein-S-isoprenylcysteine O-methyltransferase Ste14